jgi:quinol-cytochrome oxidoreductase complex cytochrome b subunit
MKFFTLHFTLPYLTMGMVFVHLGALHAIGSNNPMGSDKVPVLSFAPNFVIKDILVFFVTLVFLGTLWSLFPNDLGHPDNSMIANCMVTPPHIVPEWYFLPFYAILRSIPDKDGGIVAMAAAIGALFTLPFINSSDLRSAFYRPIFLVCLTLWVLDVIFLG